MRFKYLVRGYVEWLGLTPYYNAIPRAIGYIPEDGMIPEPEWGSLAVDFEGGQYQQRSDGLSWDWIGGSLWA